MNRSEIGKFLYDIRYIILLYIIGDFLTTFHAIENGFGFEQNGLLASLMTEFGMWSLVIVKIAILGVVFWAYRTINSSTGPVSPLLWTFSKTGISLLGLLLVINNMMVIWARVSLFEYVGML
ncbi:hypothetical protein [Methanolobus sp.]|uniref:hypothetical protein n=1 Tax=Methanolobus sp. TaxID=1874737 RepID=UPI0025FA4173|nr:hypothetical protein [Methanolobus sp.]